MRSLLLLLALSSALALDAGHKMFATFGNAQTKDFINMWKPQPLPVGQGDTMLPASKDVMKRYVRARILLEDPGIGCIAAYEDGDGLNLILCRFTKAEHSLLLPLWRPTAEEERPKTFQSLASWHKDKFDDTQLSGGALEWGDDRKAWAEAFGI